MTSSKKVGEELEVTWRIENFSMYPHEPGEAISSPLLSMGNPRHSIFYLKMYPRGWDETSSHLVAADLIRMEGSFKGQLVCKMSIVARDGSSLEGQITTNCRSIIWNRNIGIAHYGRRLRIEEDFISHFLPHDTLVVRCKLVIHNVPQRFAEDLTELSQTIYSLYESKAYSDLTLCTSDKEFKVHKFILSHRAPNFLRDIGFEVNDSKPVCINIDEISTPVLQSFIQFVYSGKLEDFPPADVPKILEITKKYGVNTQNFVELTDEVINLGSPSIISTNIKVLSKKVEWNIHSDAVRKCTKLLKDDNLFWSDKLLQGDNVIKEDNLIQGDDLVKGGNLVQCICFGPLRFLLKLQFTQEYPCISFKCLSKLEKDIFLGCKIYEGIHDVQNWTSIEYRKLQFSVDAKETEVDLPGERLQRYYSMCGLRLQMLISVSDCVETSSIDSLMFVSPEPPSQYSLSFLRNDMISLFNQTQINDSGDVTLILASTPIMAHKAILAARSPVFEDMFNCDVEENDKVNISDVDFDTGLRLVRFIYCGTVIKQSYKEDTKLYLAAERYQVSSLIKKCSSFLESHLVLSNVCDILVLAYIHSDDLLLASARKLFYCNRETVKLSRDCQLLSNTDPHFSSMMQQPI